MRAISGRIKMRDCERMLERSGIPSVITIWIGQGSPAIFISVLNARKQVGGFMYPEEIIPDRLDYQKEMSQHRFGFFIDAIIKKYYPSGNGQTAIDIGARYGVLAELLSKQGFQAYGIEYNKKCVEVAQAAGFSRVYQGTIDNVSEIAGSLKIERFNLITMTDVIEHLLDPMTDLKNLAQFQKSGDRMILTTMDMGSLGYMLFKKDWYYIHAQHTYYFDKKSLKNLFDKVGYSIEFIHRIDKIKNVTKLLPALKNYFKHKKDRKQKLNGGKRWFAEYRPSLYDMFTVVLRRD